MFNLTTSSPLYTCGIGKITTDYDHSFTPDPETLDVTEHNSDYIILLRSLQTFTPNQDPIEENTQLQVYTILHRAYHHSCNDELLLLLQVLHHGERDVQGSGYDLRGSEREPLGQTDVRDAVGLVDLDPHELLSVRGVLDVVAWQLLVRNNYGEQRNIPALSGNTAVSPATKSKVRALEPPRKTVALAWPEWK